MHWAMLAERDHPNVNLSSLRMLLVADGSNPCKSVRSSSRYIDFDGPNVSVIFFCRFFGC